MILEEINNEKQIILTLLMILILLTLGVYLSYKTLIRKAIETHVFAYLQNRNCEIIKVKSCGFLSMGDFNNEIGFSLITNDALNYVFKYVYYKDANNRNKRLTVELKSIFIFVTRIRIKTSLYEESIILLPQNIKK